MELRVFQVDAFTDTIFGGNPACVVPLTDWLDDRLMLKIAQENAVAETAFFIPVGDHYHLRWFTPDIEMDLCGHATLATAHVLRQHLGDQSAELRFESRSGLLSVKPGNDSYTLDFPSRMPVVATLPEIIRKGIDRQPKEVWKARDYILVYETEEDIQDIVLNRQVLDQINLDPGGIIITAPGRTVDFVSRFFTPQSTIFEDPVTGSAHCSLIPFWSERLHKREMTALQVSARVGKLGCIYAGERVYMSGEARTYLAGTIYIDQ
ncbi:MAG TPA: PhzF family phenazine biosynthesis protein [Ohtaekwangia sp.]|uniref:PhzF family phenazine biosynthesis protein n=1 Tax=Ohtaekwangia sp. TaxID=2066019 RepID=UPI002F9206C1